MRNKCNVSVRGRVRRVCDELEARGAVRVRECAAGRVMRSGARVAGGASPAPAPAPCA